MQYTYTYNPLENSKNDRTYRKRCIDEMYKMRFELFPNEPEENYMMHCPECDHKMIVKK